MGQYSGAAEKVRPKPWRIDQLVDPMKLGEYLAIMGCGECHGLALEGIEGFTPPLTIAKSYASNEFQTLMRDGIGLGGRDLGLMSRMTQTRFRDLTNRQVEALHAYLMTL